MENESWWTSKEPIKYSIRIFWEDLRDEKEQAKALKAEKAGKLKIIYGETQSGTYPINPKRLRQLQKEGRIKVTKMDTWKPTRFFTNI